MNPYVVATDASRPPPGHLSDGVMRTLEHMEHVDVVIVAEADRSGVERDLINDYLALAGGASWARPAREHGDIDLARRWWAARMKARAGRAPEP